MAAPATPTDAWPVAKRLWGHRYCARCNMEKFRRWAVVLDAQTSLEQARAANTKLQENGALRRKILAPNRFDPALGDELTRPWRATRSCSSTLSVSWGSTWTCGPSPRPAARSPNPCSNPCGLGRWRARLDVSQARSPDPLVDQCSFYFRTPHKQNPPFWGGVDWNEAGCPWLSMDPCLDN